MPASFLSASQYQALRFGLSGAAATALHYLIMLALLQGSLPPTAATATGALAGAWANYLLQYHYAFRPASRHAATAMKYLIVVLISWPLNLLFFTTLYSGFALPVPLAQMLATLLLALCNYWISRRFVFL